MTRRRRAARVAAVAALLLVSACTGGTDGPREAAQPQPTPSTSPSPTPEPAPRTTDVKLPQPPRPRACYRLTVRQLTRPTNGSPPVRCTQRHDAQTIHVGALDTYVGGHAVAVDSAHVQQQLRRTCPGRLAAFLGGTPEERHLSRFEVVWFSPTLSQSDRGARWFRCDVVALAGPGRLHPLPAPSRLAGLLDRAAGAGDFGLCGTAAPGDRDFTRVICARPHSWRAIATIPIPGGDSYPGVGSVRSSGESTCRDRARAQAPDPLRFRYGWEWPTREQWRTGQRFGYCWAPD